MGNIERLGNMRIQIFLPGEELPAGLIKPKLSHGARIVEIITGEEDLTDTDAVYTKNPELTLGLTTADCAALCVTDGVYIGVAHAGWRGLCAGIIEAMLEKFDQKNLLVYIGPFMHSFEIQKDFCYEALIKKFGTKYIDQNGGILTFRFKDAISSLVPETTVFDSRDTFFDHSLPSYRREKTPKRMYTTVRFTEEIA